ncbi:MAG: hypothetical protein UMS36scaffold28_76 [Phage 59_13]|nr:MAG: hypothetical protein UMS36scaffold28_76 [Phage 59_13]
MTFEEAYAEMKKRGWGFARSGPMIAVGPIQNPNFERDREPPVIEVYAMGVDPAEVVQRAIDVASTRSNGVH